MTRKTHFARAFFTIIVALFAFLTTVFSSPIDKRGLASPPSVFPQSKKDSVSPADVLYTFVVPQDVKIKDYFTFMESD